MKRLVVIGLCLAASACATHPNGRSQSSNWCADSYPMDRPWDDLNAILVPIKLKRLDVAAHQLRNSSIKEISRRDADAFARQPVPESGYHYLIRGGIFARPDAPVPEYYEQAVLARNILAWRPEQRDVLVSILQLWGGEDRNERQAYNIPMVLSSPVRLEQAYLICQTLH